MKLLLHWEGRLAVIQSRCDPPPISSAGGSRTDGRSVFVALLMINLSHHSLPSTLNWQCGQHCIFRENEFKCHAAFWQVNCETETLYLDTLLSIVRSYIMQTLKIFFTKLWNKLFFAAYRQSLICYFPEHHFISNHYQNVFFQWLLKINPVLYFWNPCTCTLLCKTPRYSSSDVLQITVRIHFILKMKKKIPQIQTNFFKKFGKNEDQNWATVPGPANTIGLQFP